MDSLPPTEPQANTGTLPGIKSSASLQARLSVTNPQHRHRASSHLPADKGSARDEHPAHYVVGNLPIPWDNYYCHNVISFGYSLLSLSIVKQRLSQHTRLKWLLLVYCSFCVAFASSGLFARFTVESDTPHALPGPDRTPSTPLHALPLEYLMTKVTTLRPEHSHLHPYFMRASALDDTVTACLWTELDNIDMLSTWAARWKGQISLLITTRSSILNETSISDKLAALRTLPSANSTLSVHILHLEPSSPDNPNAFLNLARLFAQTSTVALFPGNLSAVPPKTFSRSLLSKRLPPKPVIYSVRGRTTYPFSPLSPAIFGRDDPLWCTERFFPYVSRSVEWLECLWQIWLESFGDIEVRPTTDWIAEGRSNVAVEAPLVQNKARRRLSTKFRGETCVLATRQLAALRSPERGIDTKKARWLKRNCREWTTG